jgi:hypothetical protein
LRWSKGHLLAFAETGPYLFLNVIFGKLFIKTRFTDKKEKKQKRTFKSMCLGFVESIRHRFASFDTLMQLTPVSVLNIVRWLIVPVFMYACYCYAGGVESVAFFSGGTYLAKLLRFIFPFEISFTSGVSAFFTGLAMQLWLRLLYRIGKYLENTLAAVYLFIMERKRIIRIPFYKKVLYTFTWPLFDIIGRYTTYLALFVKVTWKPIPHESKITIEDIERNKQEAVK